MCQRKSMIPKPRLSTPRRPDRPPTTLQSQTPRTPSRTPSRTPAHTPARTPSRIPRPPPRSNTLSQHTKPLMKRGDTLAEHVIQTGIITSHTPQHQTTQKNRTTYDFESFKSLSSSRLSDDESQLFKYEKGNQTSVANKQLTSLNSDPKTPPRKLTTSHISNSHLCNPTSDFTTPEHKNASREAAQDTSHDEVVIDEELVTRTPAKHKNSEWLASFGIDISLLKITDDDDAENHDPNITPSRDFRKTNCERDESGLKTKLTNSRAFQRRRATDFYGYAESTRENLAGPPTRVSSVRKSRRASARISVRELDALKYNEGIDIQMNRVEKYDTPKGSDVFLTPVRATRKQREKNGTPVVLSEVRRSLRINTPSSKLVPKNSVRGRIELLEANDHSYIPNPTLSDRATLSG